MPWRKKLPGFASCFAPGGIAGSGAGLALTHRDRQGLSSQTSLLRGVCKRLGGRVGSARVGLRPKRDDDVSDAPFDVCAGLWSQHLAGRDDHGTGYEPGNTELTKGEKEVGMTWTSRLLERRPSLAWHTDNTTTRCKTWCTRSDWRGRSDRQRQRSAGR